ncbi:15-hydroxyprostaglandin dehydrogenase [NAD(+)]-like [Anoplophora glabripennis]|uniref:15-hydroxyprostaglandin dehydrogenase [NAD(+)]-like n=1 Tax=Anoplophora glabripennis TaxID=217634 RepID=UPI000874D7FC|nr:15-hydroxyprostaglandin dehydrogenase [NAD(+)]-like [Anoplophora glabripennis]
MVFNIQGKVALVTGGGSGLGLEYAKILLRNGAKGVTLADIDSGLGNVALSQMNKEFGPDKTIFVTTDVSNIKQFEDAFRKTIETFGYVDILINNAGILNDGIWEKEISINVVRIHSKCK